MSESEPTAVLHLMAGLPRGGNVLLTNLLAQNPRFHVTTPGGILSVLQLVRNEWNKMQVFRASPNEAGKLRVLRGIVAGYYADARRPVILDRSLGWLGSLELAEAVLGRPVKVLVCVRDVRDVLATFERQWRTVPQMQEFVRQHPSFPRWETVASRCEVWAGGDEPVGIAYNQIKDALARGYRDRLHFVELETLARSPREAMARVYEFLGEPEFAHDFQDIRQVVWDSYSLYGIPERHDIPSYVAPVEPIWPELLGAVGQRYAGLTLW
jgi:sulfotransferase